MKWPDDDDVGVLQGLLVSNTDDLGFELCVFERMSQFFEDISLDSRMTVRNNIKQFVDATCCPKKKSDSRHF